MSVYGPSAKREERGASLGKRRCVLVLSDVHLAPTFKSDRLPFRSAAFSPAAYLSQTIDRAVEHARQCGQGRAGDCSLEIVLAGDVFDFDVAQSAEEAEAILRLADTTTRAVAAEVMQRTLDDHLPFARALQRATQAGARVVVLPGNHDAQLGFGIVRTVLEQVIGPSTFAPWYYPAAGGAVHVEHGHLYDPLCTVARLCLEDLPCTERTIGTVSSFYAPLLLVGVDPFVTDPFSERKTFREAMMTNGLPGTRTLLTCMKELIVAAAATGDTRDDVRRLALQLGREPSEIDYLRGFFAPKANANEVIAICSGQVDYGKTVEERTRRAMVAATSMHRAGVAVVGHTHRAGATVLSNGSALLNSGAWTPRRNSNEPVGSYAWIMTDGDRITNASVRNVYRT